MWVWPKPRNGCRLTLQTRQNYPSMNLIHPAPGPVGVRPQECTLCSGLPKSNRERGRLHLCLCRPHDWNDDALQGQDWFGPRIILRCVEFGEENIFTAWALEQGNIKVAKKCPLGLAKVLPLHTHRKLQWYKYVHKGLKLICSDCKTRKLMKNALLCLLMQDLRKE